MKKFCSLFLLTLALAIQSRGASTLLSGFTQTNSPQNTNLLVMVLRPGESNVTYLVSISNLFARIGITVDGSSIVYLANPFVMTAGYFFNNQAFAAPIIFNSTGSDYGKIQNTAANLWSLAHNTLGGTNLGTPALSWDANNKVYCNGRLYVTNQINFLPSTNLVAGTNCTLNAACGRVRIASGKDTFYVTNNTVSATSIILTTVNSFDSFLPSAPAVASSGLITIYASGLTTSDCDVTFLVLNP